MLPVAIANLLRFSGIAVTAVLIAAPWLIATLSEDPFLLQNWLVFALGALAIAELAVVFLFFRPKKGHFGLFRPLLLFFASISLAMYFSDFQVSLRVSLIWVTLLLLLAFLRLSRNRNDNPGTASALCLSGFLMSIYGLFQKSGYDFFHWSSSSYQMVGTFTNPNYLAAYVMLTAIFTLGMALESNFQQRRDRLLFLLMFVPQAAVVVLSSSIGAMLGLGLGLVLFFTSFWEVRPGRILRLSPFVAGAILAVVLTILQGIVFYSTSSYPWEKLSSPPYQYFTIISRLVVWQMGYSVFLSHPAIGLGPGAISFMMPQQRPPLGTSLGLKLFNDDPHSLIVSLLAEIGFFGFFAACTIFCYLIGSAIWRRSKCFNPCDSETTEKEGASIKWLPALLSGFVVAIAFLFKLIALPTFFFAIPMVVCIHLIANCFGDALPKQFNGSLTKTPMVALLVFLFHSTFNNNIGVIPLLITALLLASELMSNSLRTLKWSRRFSFSTLPYLCVPVVFVFTAYNLQSSYQNEQVMLFQGRRLLEQKQPDNAQRAFEIAVRANPQSLKAHFGLAISLKRQNRLDEARATFETLDRMVPNVFNARFELARILLERKHLLEAHKYALKSLQWNMSPKNYELLGNILLTEGKIQEAERIFTEALLIIPESDREERLAADRIRLNLAALFAGRNDYKQCEHYLSQIQSGVADSGDALYLRGVLLSQQEKYDEALPYFEKALIQNPENPKSLNAVGFILVKTEKDLERAQKLLETAHQQIKTSETPMLSELLMVAHSLGTLYWKQGKTAEAEKLLEIAWEQCPPEWDSLKSARLNDLLNFYRETGNDRGLEKLGAEATTASAAVEIHSTE